MTPATIINMVIMLLIGVIGAYIKLRDNKNDERHGDVVKALDEIKLNIKEGHKYTTEHLEDLYSKTNSNRMVVNVHEERLDTIDKLCTIHKKYKGG